MVLCYGARLQRIRPTGTRQYLPHCTLPILFSFDPCYPALPVRSPSWATAANCSEDHDRFCNLGNRPLGDKKEITLLLFSGCVNLFWTKWSWWWKRTEAFSCCRFSVSLSNSGWVWRSQFEILWIEGFIPALECPSCLPQATVFARNSQRNLPIALVMQGGWPEPSGLMQKCLRALMRYSKTSARGLHWPKQELGLCCQTNTEQVLTKVYLSFFIFRVKPESQAVTKFLIYAVYVCMSCKKIWVAVYPC